MLKTFVLGLFVSLSFLAANTPDKTIDKAQSLPEGTKKVKVIDTRDITSGKAKKTIYELAHKDGYLVLGYDIEYGSASFYSEAIVPIECGGLSFHSELNQDYVDYSYLMRDVYMWYNLFKYSDCIVKLDKDSEPYLKGLESIADKAESVHIYMNSDEEHYLSYVDTDTFDKYRNVVLENFNEAEPISKVTYPVKTSVNSDSITLPVYEIVIVTRADRLKRLYETYKFEIEN